MSSPGDLLSNTSLNLFLGAAIGSSIRVKIAGSPSQKLAAATILGAAGIYVAASQLNRLGIKSNFSNTSSNTATSTSTSSNLSSTTSTNTSSSNFDTTFVSSPLEESVLDIINNGNPVENLL
jgi:hypothetical protein